MPAKHPRRRAVVLAAAFALALIALAALLLDPDEGGVSQQRVSFPEFMAEVEAGQVEAVTIGEDGVSFTLAGDEAAYVTDNPGAPDFRERLLMAGVEVSSETSASAVVDVLLDVLIFAMVLVPLGYGAARLVSLDRSTFKLVRRTGVTFDDIAGMGELKRELGSVVDALRRPQAYAERGIRPVKGVILEGPPGNGKTLFARALASEAHVGFIATKGADFQSAFMSLGAAKIRALFRKARRHRPCIVFIDEFDSIGERRNYAGTGVDKENNRIITAMLNEMDGFEERSGVLVVAATNSYRSLDPALVRPGRFDLKFTVGNPDAATRAELVRLYTARARRELDEGLAPETLVALFDGLSCAAIEACLNGAAAQAAMRDGRAGGGQAGGRPSRSDGVGGGSSQAAGAAGDQPGGGRITLADVRFAAARCDAQLRG